MARYGFFEEEPLLIVQDQAEPGSFLVIEGNRRLAALRLLTDSTARDEVERPRWGEWAEEFASHNVIDVPCLLYNHRDELANYLGFRHVSGIIKWTAEAKARFIVSLVDSRGYTFYEAGRAIGSRADAIRRQYFAYRALRSAQQQGVDVNRAEESFGVWYRALQNPGIRNYAGVRGWLEDELGPGDDALSKGVDPLAEVLQWVFGGGDEGNEPRPVIRDSRELDRLGKVLADPKAVAVLKNEGSLRPAEEMTVSDRASILGSLNSAIRYLILAIGEADRFIGDPETIEMVERVSDRVERLLRLVRPTTGAPAAKAADKQQSSPSSQESEPRN